MKSFSATGTSGDFKLSDYLGKYVVLYFYPKDNTPGCTIESKGFSEFYSEFLQMNAVVVGVSKDKLEAHNKFKQKYNFPFDLLSDVDGSLCKLFDVIKEKQMFGKKIQGIARSTFLFDTKGNLIHEWRNVRVKGHVKDVLEKLRLLTSKGQ